MGVTSKLKTFVHQLLMVITGVEPATVFPVNRRFVKQDKGQYWQKLFDSEVRLAQVQPSPKRTITSHLQAE